MASKEDVTQVVFEAVDEVNTLLPKEMQLSKSTDAPLFGPKGNLDSLGLINLMVAVERKLDNQGIANINVADEQAMSRPDEIFKTVESLMDYIYALLNEK